MHTQVYTKCLFYLSLFGVLASILVGFYDVIFGTIWEGIHLVLEVIEMGLDRLIEHLFHTDLKQTQLIVFYIMLGVGGVLIYITWKILVYLCKDVGQNLKEEWLELKDAVTSDWQVASIVNRILFVLIFLSLNYLISFFFF